MLITAEIPDEMAPWVATVFAETFPALAADKTPSEAIRAVIVSWVRQTLITYETDRARRAGEDAVVAAAKARDDAVQAAVQSATAAADLLVVTPEPPPEEPPADPAPETPAP